MKWPLFVMTLLIWAALLGGALAYSAGRLRSVELGESDVGSIKTALGYTTMLQFDSRPTSVILGDQDAFKIEAVGNGLAIKPLLPRSASNLFVFTDYDRFNFTLSVVPSKEAHQSLQVKRMRFTDPDLIQERAPGRLSPAPGTSGEPLTYAKLTRTASCNEATLTVTGMSWPKSRSALIVQFTLRYQPKNGRDIEFEPGDLELHSGSSPARIDTLQLSALRFTESQPLVTGALVIKQTDLKPGQLLVLRFSPNFLGLKNPSCLQVKFRRR